MTPMSCHQQAASPSESIEFGQLEFLPSLAVLASQPGLGFRVRS